jgi:Neuraminidase (sialidase)
MICRKFSSQILTIFTEKKLVDAATSNMMVFFGKVRCSSTQLKRSIWSKQSYLHLETPQLQDVFFSKSNSIHSGNNVLDAPASYRDGF